MNVAWTVERAECSSADECYGAVVVYESYGSVNVSV